MKKFGTPNGAAPGNANENPGFEGEGTPDADRGALGLVGVVEVFLDPDLFDDDDFFDDDEDFC